MTTELDEIIQAAENCFSSGTDRLAFEPMALVRAIREGVAAAVAEKREECAKLCDEVEGPNAHNLAIAIRSR